METGSQSSGFTSHCLPHCENLTRLIECGEIVSGDEINPINPYLVKRPTIITKLPPIVKSSEPSTNLTAVDKMATSKSPNSLINYRSFNLNPSSAPSSASSSPSPLSTSATFDDIDHWKGYETNCDTFNSFNNPALKLRLLEKNLQFIKDQHKMVLNCLHNQIEDLNRKNRDLQFKLIVNNLYPDCLEGPSSKLSSVMPSESGKNSLPLEVINRLNNLEIEVGRLRLALGEALKMNASLRNRLMLKSTNKLYQQKQQSASKLVETETLNLPKYKQSASSNVESFRETWRAINSAKVESSNSFLPGIK